MKRKIANVINQVLAKTGCALVPVRETQNSVTSNTNSYMESAEHKRALVNEWGLIAKQFFDCHVNHAKRIIEAHSKGLRRLVFDDNLPLHKLYISGCPGIPTADMVYHWPENGPTRIEFVHQAAKIVREIDLDQVRQARNVMKKHVVFPDVGDVSGFGGFFFLTYVELAAV